jgi:hypothetical protein
MTFARRVFLVASVYGSISLLPQYFLEGRYGLVSPPAITHPEFFYGFIGVALAWQVAFFIVSRDPIRYRPLMIPAVLEKATFAVATTWLFSAGRLNPQMFAAGLIDLLLGVLFAIAYAGVGKEGRITGP